MSTTTDAAGVASAGTDEAGAVLGGRTTGVTCGFTVSSQQHYRLVQTHFRRSNHIRGCSFADR